MISLPLPEVGVSLSGMGKMLRVFSPAEGRTCSLKNERRLPIGERCEHHGIGRLE